MKILKFYELNYTNLLNIDYSPGKTSVNQISYGIKYLVKNFKVKTNLDYGGGKYDTGTNYLITINGYL